MDHPIDKSTYSPDDNKIRLYPAYRLDKEDYDKVKEAGFKWAPKQEIFVAPMWTPQREDIALELSGQCELDDDDQSLIDRQEERAERFEGYSANRLRDARQASKAVEDIAGNIPLGQPILVGHHSEKRARRDQKKIEAGMERAVKNWGLSEYWERRAKSAIAHAKYKERPQVRARRIKKIEADRRKVQRDNEAAEKNRAIWADIDTREKAERRAANSWCDVTLPDGSKMGIHRAILGNLIDWQEVREQRIKAMVEYSKRCDRWIEHYDNRLNYERAMLDEAGASDLLKPKPRPTQPPLLNFRAPQGLQTENRYHKGQIETFPQIEMTKAEFAKEHDDCKGTRLSLDKSYRFRICIHRKKGFTNIYYAVFLTDSKVHPTPQDKGLKGPTPQEFAQKLIEIDERNAAYLKAAQEREARNADPERQQFKAMAEAVKTGEPVKVVSVPQLFETPPELAERMALEAEIKPGHKVLEPSAGTGRLIRAIYEAEPLAAISAVEINQNLGEALRNMKRADGHNMIDALFCGDFMFPAPTPTYDRILMNPPFVNGQDIDHVKHAFKTLKPGGRIVAIMGEGSFFRSDRKAREFRAWLEDIEGTSEQLPPNTFASSGTGVNTRLVIIDKPEATPAAQQQPKPEGAAARETHPQQLSLFE